MAKNDTTHTSLAVVYRAPAQLTPQSRNSRKHSKKHIDQIARSIKTFGFSVPVLTDAGDKILAGHARVLAALKIGLAQIPTIKIEHLTAQQATAFMIADNRLSELSDWDEQILAEMLKELSGAQLDFDIEVTGFTLDEIEIRIESIASLGQDSADLDDQLPEAFEDLIVSEVGDLWLLGNNRVLNGDATNPADIERLMSGKRASLAFTDPPYGVNYANSPKDKIRGKSRPILNDDLGGKFGEFLLNSCKQILSVTDGGIYICMSSSALHLLQDAFVKAGGQWSTFIIWTKHTFTLGRADYQRQYEPILYGWRKGGKRHWCGARDQSDVWSFNKPAKNDLHPTMKPVELVMQALRNSSLRGDIVLDSFLGSGTTLIAAERTGRISYGLELDPRYVDIVLRRWQQHTGDEAVHATTGEKFNDILIRKRGS